MLRSAATNARELEDSNATGVDSWERFCREEARQAACSFLERVKRFKSRNASARDVHDSTFTNEFSAAFLEESSMLMASGDTQMQASCSAVPRMNGQSQSHGFPLNRSASTRAGAGAGGYGGRAAFVRQESKASVKSSGGKKAWWSNIFKWSKSKRDRRNNGRPGLSSSGEYLSPSSSRSNSSSTNNQSAGSRRRVILDGLVQLLDLNETEGPLQWTQCKLVLAEAQGHHQVEIFMPPKSSVPRTTLFCFLIEDVRSTSTLEIPDYTTCFVIKSQNHGEHVFKAETESKKQCWIQAILDCKSQIIRSASAQTHLATLPRTPQRTPVRLPNGSSSNRGGVVSLDTSPAMHCCSGVGGAGGVAGGRGIGPRYNSYASSDSLEQKKSTLNVGAESDGDDSMMDVTSLIRRLNHASPSRRRKVQSMFVDSSNLHSVHPTTATATMMTSSHYQPPPLLSYSPPNYEEDYLHHHPHHHQPPSLPARLPFSSLPTDCSNSTSVSDPPPPLPKRNPPARSGSMSVSCSSSRESQSHHHHHHHRTSPSHMTHPVSSAAATATSTTAPPPLPPMSTARLTAISTTNDVTSTSVNGCNATNGTSSSSARIQASPRRKYSQSFVDIPPTIHSGSSQGNLELCSQSSSSSALHPVSLAAVQRRRSSITSNPGDSTTNTTTAAAQPMSLQAFQSKPSERVRKVSAPVLIAGDQAVKQLSLVGEGGDVEPALQKKVMGNGAAPGQKNVYDSSDILNDVTKEASPVPESDRELEDEEKTIVEGDGEVERERKGEGEKEEKETGIGKERENTKQGESEQPPSSTSSAGDGSRGDGSGTAESALSPVQRRHQQEKCNGAIENGINDEATSRKATFTFPFSSSSQANQTSSTNSSYSPPVPPRTSSPLLIHQRSESRGRSGSPLTPDLVATSHLSYNVRSPHPPSQDNEESESGGLMIGTLVAGTGMGSLGTIGGGSGRMMGGGVSERRGHRRGHSLISSHSIQTNPSTRTNSSSSDGTESNPANSSSVPGISNPIYVETTEGERAQVSQRVELHTQHPYEHWATSQQDVANLRLLSRYPWFHGMVSRANASQLVLAEGENGTGQYLVRQSESREGDFVLTFNYHNRAKHLRMAVDESGCNIQHLWFDDVPSMLDYFKTNSIPLESFWLNDDVKLTTYIDRQASDSFRTTTVVNMDRLARVPPRRSRSLHLSTANSVNSAAATSANSSNPETPLPLPLDANASSASSSNSQSTNSLPQSARNSTGWRLFRSQRSSSAGNVGRVQRRHSANVGSLLNTGMNSNRSSGRRRRSNNENNYLVRNY